MKHLIIFPFLVITLLIQSTIGVAPDPRLAATGDYTTTSFPPLSGVVMESRELESSPGTTFYSSAGVTGFIVYKVVNGGDSFSVFYTESVGLACTVESLVVGTVAGQEYLGVTAECGGTGYAYLFTVDSGVPVQSESVVGSQNNIVFTGEFVQLVSVHSGFIFSKDMLTGLSGNNVTLTGNYATAVSVGMNNSVVFTYDATSISLFGYDSVQPLGAGPIFNGLTNIDYIGAFYSIQESMMLLVHRESDTTVSYYNLLDPPLLTTGGDISGSRVSIATGSITHFKDLLDDQFWLATDDSNSNYIIDISDSLTLNIFDQTPSTYKSIVPISSTQYEYRGIQETGPSHVVIAYDGCINYDDCTNCTLGSSPFTRVCTDCNTGYTLNVEECDDIDECSDPNACSYRAICQNLMGSFECNCSNSIIPSEDLCPGTPQTLNKVIGASLDPSIQVYRMAYNNKTLAVATNLGVYFYDVLPASLSMNGGVFGPAPSYSVGWLGSIWSSGDDFVLIDGTSQQLSFYNGETMIQMDSFFIGSAIDFTVVEDRNGDGYPDIVAASTSRIIILSDNSSAVVSYTPQTSEVDLHSNSDFEDTVYAYLGKNPTTKYPVYEELAYMTGSGLSVSDGNNSGIVPWTGRTNYGVEVQPMGDLWQNGVTDIAVGADNTLTMLFRNGMVKLDDIVDVTHDTLNLQATPVLFGKKFVCVGDLDGDTFPDFVAFTQPEVGETDNHLMIIYPSAPNVCTASDCISPRTCIETFAGAQCSSCGSGYTELNSTHCEDVQECLTEPCGTNATCTEEIGSFSCDCDVGFIGDGYVCGLGTCPSYCVSPCPTDPDYGFFICQCKNGYTINGLDECEDIDECDPAVGLANCFDINTCVNTEGSYTCSCPSGYIEDTTRESAIPGIYCADVDECKEETNDCAKVGAACKNIPGGYQCECLRGYSGDGKTCTKDDAFVNPECNGGVSIPGNCVSYPSGFQIWKASSSSVQYNGETLDMTNVDQMQFLETLTLSSGASLSANGRDGSPLVTAQCADLSDSGTVSLNIDEPFGTTTTDIIVVETASDCLEGNFDALTITGYDGCVTASGELTSVEQRIIATITEDDSACAPPEEIWIIVLIVILIVLAVIALGVAGAIFGPKLIKKLGEGDGSSNNNKTSSSKNVKEGAVDNIKDMNNDRNSFLPGDDDS